MITCREQGAVAGAIPLKSDCCLLSQPCRARIHLCVCPLLQEDHLRPHLIASHRPNSTSRPLPLGLGRALTAVCSPPGTFVRRHVFREVPRAASSTALTSDLASSLVVLYVYWDRPSVATTPWPLERRHRLRPNWLAPEDRFFEGDGLCLRCLLRLPQKSTAAITR